MQEVEFSKKDLDNIRDIAQRRFVSDTARYGDPTFLCKCYINALKEYTKLNNLMMVDGNVYKKD